MHGLQDQVMDWARHWNCRPDGAAIPTEAALLLPVRRGDAVLMLKVLAPGSDEVGAAGYLAALDGRHAVGLVAAEGPALLMERLDPLSPSLADLALGGADDAATGVLCDLALGMQAALSGADLPDLIPLDRRIRDLWSGRGAADDLRLLQWAQGLAGDLLADRQDWRALHGDLHHFNALCDRNRGWLAIDPKGVLGPPAYDLANTILNPFPHSDLVHDPARMARQAAVAAERLGISVAGMLRWVALQGCLGLAWGLDDPARGHWSTGARLAGRLAGLAPPV